MAMRARNCGAYYVSACTPDRKTCSHSSCLERAYEATAEVTASQDTVVSHGRGRIVVPNALLHPDAVLLVETYAVSMGRSTLGQDGTTVDAASAPVVVGDVSARLTEPPCRGNKRWLTSRVACTWLAWAVPDQGPAIGPNRRCLMSAKLGITFRIAMSRTYTTAHPFIFHCSTVQ